MPRKVSASSLRPAKERFGEVPYRITPKGEELLETSVEMPDLTDYQRKALQFLQTFYEEGFIPSSTIAAFYNLPPQAMRGPCYWLMRKGLIEVKED